MKEEIWVCDDCEAVSESPDPEVCENCNGESFTQYKKVE